MSQSEFTDATKYLNDPEQLRHLAQEDGYLFFRGLIPVDDILRMRAELLDVMRRHRLCRPGSESLDGRLDIETLNRLSEDQVRLDIGVPHGLYDEVQKLSGVHRLPHHPQLQALYHAICGQEVLLHPRHIVRMVTAHPAMAPTPAHQDFTHIQGTNNTWTCWFPIGDCPTTMGGLTVLRRSHRLGHLPFQPAQGAGNLETQLCSDEDDWVTTDYHAGDVLSFPSLTVHKALPCQMPDQVRLSFDIRYQSADEPVEARSLLPHCDLDWEDIYRDWIASEDLKYYWRQRTLVMSPWDETIKEPGGRRIC